MEPRKIAFYTRVSTADQNADLQLREMQDYGKTVGLIKVNTSVQTFADVASGASTRRPALDRLMGLVRLRDVDMVVVWKLDRLGRSLQDCLALLGEMESRNVRFLSVTESIDINSRNPTGRLVLQILGAAAEFERSLILERSEAGLRRYREDLAAGRIGKELHSRSGKDLPPGRPRVVVDRSRVRELRSQGYSLRKISELVKIGTGTVRRILKGDPA